MKTIFNKGKSTEIQIEVRINEVMRLMIQGARRYDILDHALKEWGIARAMADNYIAKAKEQLRELSKDKLDLEEEFGLAIMQLTDLYKKAYLAKEYNTARMIRADLSRLTGIDTMKVVISTEKMDAEQIISELTELLNGNVSGGD